ncbi:unnamed protein product [Brassica oleracea]
MEIKKLKSLRFSVAGGARARRRHPYCSLLLPSFGPWLLSTSIVVGFNLHILDLALLPAKKSTDVLAICGESTVMVLLTGGSRKACSIITLPHHVRQSEWSLSSHFRSAILGCCCTSTPLYFTSVKAHFSVATRTSSCRSISTLFYKRDSVSLLGGFTTSNLSIFTVSPPSRPTASLSSDEVRYLRSAACCLPTIMLRVGYADISPTLSPIWAWPMLFTKTVSPLLSSWIINSQIIKSSERAWPIIYFMGLDPINSSSMIFGGFTEALIRTTVHTKPYFSALKRFFTLCLSVDSPLPLSSTSSSKDRGSSSPEAFPLRSAAFPALKQLKLSKVLTVLLSCGAIRTGSEDTTDFFSAIFRGVNWLLLTSRFSVTMFYSGFAVNLVLTHSSFTQNLLSFYPRGFSTSIFYAVLSYCNARRARIISSSKCSPIV